MYCVVFVYKKVIEPLFQKVAHDEGTYNRHLAINNKQRRQCVKLYV